MVESLVQRRPSLSRSRSRSLSLCERERDQMKINNLDTYCEQVGRSDKD
jgi:hypothetical protein